MGNQTKERLVEAALALFAEKGYRSTTIQDIAAKAGTNVASINYHFQSKANFYAEVVLSATELEDDSLLRVEPTADNAEKLLYEFLGLHLRELHDENAGSLIAQIRAHEMAEPSPVLEIIVERLAKPMIRTVEGIIRSLLPAKTGSDVIRRHTAGVLGHIHIYKFARPIFSMIYPDVIMDEQELDRLRDHIFRSIMAAIRAEYDVQAGGDDHVVA
jgi:AcrR family transcriptional regulator